jgi:hypothetical protein
MFGFEEEELNHSPHEGRWSTMNAECKGLDREGCATTLEHFIVEVGKDVSHEIHLSELAKAVTREEEKMRAIWSKNLHQDMDPI